MVCIWYKYARYCTDVSLASLYYSVVSPWLRQKAYCRGTFWLLTLACAMILEWGGVCRAILTLILWSWSRDLSFDVRLTLCLLSEWWNVSTSTQCSNQYAWGVQAIVPCVGCLHYRCKPALRKGSMKSSKHVRIFLKWKICHTYVTHMSHIYS